MRLLLDTHLLVIMQALERPDFRVEPAVLRRVLLDGGWQEVPRLHRVPCP